MSRKYALFVGSSEYEAESLDDLKSPISDVQDLAQLFRDPAIGNFDDVTELINRTETEIRQAIGSFFLKKKPEDLLLLYFSGHGVLDDRGHLYLAVKDTKPDLLRATAIAADFIADDMDLCRSKRQILILDCCHSGAFRRGIKGSGKAVTAATFEGNGSGRIILTASDRREFAMEGNQVLEQAKTSLFTHFLLEGIKSGEADRDGDNFISLDEWYDYAYDKVVSKLPTQTPRRWVYNQEGKLIIARNPQPGEIKPVELSPELRASIEDPRPNIRLRAASELAELLAGTDRQLAVAAREALQNLQNDDNRNVRNAASQVLNDYEKAGYFSEWLKMLITIWGATRWKRWIVGTAVAGMIIIAGWSLYATLDRSEQVNNGDPPNNKQIDKSTSLIGPSLRDENSTQQDSLSSRDDPPADNQGFNPNTGGDASTQKPDNEQQESGTTPGHSQDPPNSGSQKTPDQPINNVNTTTGEGSQDDEPISQPEVQPLDLLKQDIEDYETDLAQAIMLQQWKDIPAPIAEFYKNLLADFYKNFNVIHVETATGELQIEGKTATLPVKIDIGYKQKGREDLKTLPIPANWVWENNDTGFVLKRVEKQ